MGNIVTLAASIIVDTGETLSVNKGNLATAIGNAGDTYFNNQLNWSSIEVEYRSTTGKQREIVKIDAAASTGTFQVSATARIEGWLFTSIRVKDFDGDSYILKRSDLAGADYDDTAILSASSPVYYNNDFSSGAASYEFTSSGMSFDIPNGELVYTHGSSATGTYTVLVQDDTNGYADITAAAYVPTSSLTSDFSVDVNMSDISIPGFGAMAGGTIDCKIQILDKNSLNAVESSEISLSTGVNSLSISKAALQAGSCLEVGYVNVIFTSKNSGGTPTTDFSTSWDATEISFFAN